MTVETQFMSVSGLLRHELMGYHGQRNQLVFIFTDISNLSLSQAIVPTCLKSATIILVPLLSNITTWNDCRQAVLTISYHLFWSTFEGLVQKHIKYIFTHPPTTRTVLSPLLYSLSTSDYTATHLSKTLIKYAEGTTEQHCSLERWTLSSGKIVYGQYSRYNTWQYLLNVTWLYVVQKLDV